MLVIEVSKEFEVKRGIEMRGAIGIERVIEVSNFCP